jgi:sialic acid synthase SpsE
VPVGYSDHTVGLTIPIAAVALGASVIEKHFTLDRSLPGPDHQASLEPDNLARLVQSVRAVEVAMGDGIKRPTDHELPTAQVARKSLVSRQEIRAGTKITLEMIDIKRPGTGIMPRELHQVIGRTARVDIPADHVLTWEMI